ncbi:MAG: phosphotransferase, partial [Actinobacteria bacterium]|nr:phosphotransferase [Actinomycetota bacterium]
AERTHRAGAVGAEAEWTGALAACGLPVPRVIAARDGSASVTVSSPGVPGPRECVLLSWTPGHRLRRPIGPGEARDLGRLCGRLHAVPADRARLPAGVLDGRSSLAAAPWAR